MEFETLDDDDNEVRIFISLEWSPNTIEPEGTVLGFEGTRGTSDVPGQVVATDK